MRKIASKPYSIGWSPVERDRLTTLHSWNNCLSASLLFPRNAASENNLVKLKCLASTNTILVYTLIPAINCRLFLLAIVIIVQKRQATVSVQIYRVLINGLAKRTAHSGQRLHGGIHSGVVQFLSKDNYIVYTMGNSWQPCPIPKNECCKAETASQFLPRIFISYPNL